eukprot:686204-Rhodomonas_salina.2
MEMAAPVPPTYPLPPLPLLFPRPPSTLSICKGWSGASKPGVAQQRDDEISEPNAPEQNEIENREDSVRHATASGGHATASDGHVTAAGGALPEDRECSFGLCGVTHVPTRHTPP